MHEILTLLGKLSLQTGGRCYLRLFGDGSWSVRDGNNACIVGPFDRSGDPTQQIVMQLALAIHTPTKADAMLALHNSVCNARDMDILQRFIESRPDDAQGEAK
jgi:hypothetical protein